MLPKKLEYALPVSDGHDLLSLVLALLQVGGIREIEAEKIATKSQHWMKNAISKPYFIKLP